MTILLTLCFCTEIHADEPTDTLSTDTIATVVVKRPGLIKRIINYFDESNDDKPMKKLDFSVIGGPHYSSDTQFGVGLVGAGFYRRSLTDSVTLPSNVSLYGDISTVGFVLVGVKGNHYFSLNRHRLDYKVYFYSFPRKFWGIGYERGLDMSNKSDFRELYVNATADYVWQLPNNFFAGPGLEYTYSDARRRQRPELWDGQSPHISTQSVGFKVMYDTRDNLTATLSGVLLQLEQRFSPAFLGNRYAFSSTDFRCSYFRHLWRDATMALRYHTKLCYGDVPWVSMATFGGSNVMRGYYDGRFRDKGEMDLTLELRQHIWRRNGAVIWVGAGTVYPKFSAMRLRHILPNAGIGYRWEFKRRTNVRLDFGVGRGETGFVFSINEAF